MNRSVGRRRLVSVTLAGVVLALPGVGARAAGPRPPPSRAAAPTHPPTVPVSPAFARGVHAFRAGSYAVAERELALASGAGARPTATSTAKAGASGSAHARAGASPPLLNVDWATYLQAESAFYAGHPATARAEFEALARRRGSRFAAMAAWRIADCLWTEGDHAAAVEHYRKLPAHPAAEIDPAVARFRVALFAEERQQPDAARAFLAFYRDFPEHPWASEAQRHLAADAGPGGRAASATAAGGRAGESATPGPSRPTAAVTITPEDHLRRAETLTRDRNWAQALNELAELPGDLPPALAIERDYQIGMTKFHMRRDYAKAAELLLTAAPALTGDKAVSALFHGSRALSRVDRDDEAIAGYRRVVAEFPTSRFAAEAQFLSGWLDYNRGRYRESLPGLRATVERFGKSPFADDAAWCLAFAHYLLGELGEAASGLERYARLPPTGMTAEEQAARVAYWRARLASKDGHAERAKAAYRDLNLRWPFTFYGVVARARLAEWGLPAPIELPAPASTKPPASAKPPAARTTPPAALARIDELAAAGLDVEAGWELERVEKAFLGGAGNGAGSNPALVEMLLRRYAELENFHRAYQLAESRQSGAALASAPTGGARLWWEAAYPRAYRELVDRFGPQNGNPDLFLYTIMRKESGFSPWDVSVADARGLLQMVPPTSAQVARDAGLDFAADELYEPDVNIRLGALYIGGLARKFQGQIPLIAGAYNAGPRAMAKWCDQHGHHAIDEFVELIAFTQTREYAKRVVGIQARYRHLYGPSEYVQPLAVNPTYAATGPDY